MACCITDFHNIVVASEEEEISFFEDFEVDKVFIIKSVQAWRADCPQDSTYCNISVCVSVPVNDTMNHTVRCKAGGERKEFVISGKVDINANITDPPTEGNPNHSSSMSAMAVTAIGGVIVWAVLV